MAGRVLRLYITADNRVAVRAINEVGTASGRTARKIEEDSNRQARSFAVVEKGSSRLKGAVSTLAGTFGLGGLAFGIADVVKEGIAFQQQQAQLQNALRNTGQYSKAAMEQVNRAADALATHGGFSAPQNLAALGQFIRLTGSATRSVQLLGAATNLARAPGTGLDLVSSQRMIAQLLTGNVGRLQKYIGILQPVKTAENALAQAHKVDVFNLEAQAKSLGKAGPMWLKQQLLLHGLTPEMINHAKLLDRQATATEALRRIQEKYGGSTAAFSKTTAGAISNLRNSFQLLTEHLGAKLLPILSSVVQWLSKNQTTVLVLVGALTGLGALILTVKFAMAAWSAVTKVARGATWLYNTALRVLGITTATTAGEVETAGATMQTSNAATSGSFRMLSTTATTTSATVGLEAGTMAARVESADAAIETANAGAKASFLGMIGPIGLAASAALAAYQLFHKTTNFGIQSGSTAAQVTSQINSYFQKNLGMNAPQSYINQVLAKLKAGGQLKAQGGLISPLYRAAGGPIGTDTVPVWATPGEFVLRREAVQNIGIQQLNSINATGSIAGPGRAPDEVYVAGNVQLFMGQRVVTEQAVHFAARRAALSGAIAAK